jgi:LytS/YehU family sensor histidine kinase
MIALFGTFQWHIWQRCIFTYFDVNHGYLLQNNHGMLCPLQNEIKFIEAYFHLMKTRYGKGIEMELNIEQHYLNYQIPPLTLQLLVENAVKHNVAAPTAPLVIKIFNQNYKLVVENNIKKKRMAVVSNKIGLTNIITKYKLLGKDSLQIEQDDMVFRVVLPLI